jgi:putative phosphoesterase
MRLALLSDIHGNPIALDAVLAEIEEQGGVDGYWVLGDIAAIGYDPVSVITRLSELPNLCIIRGNADRYLFTGDRPPPTVEDVRRDPGLLPIFTEVADSFAWTQGYLSAVGWLDWIAKLPLEERLTLPDGTRLLAVHASPGCDDGPGVHPGLIDKELENLLIGCEADLVCVGHTHIPLERTVNGVQIVNLGSVSNPVTADLRASYVLLEADTSGHSVHFRRVNYDREVVIAAIRRSRHPASAYLIRFMRGEILSRWA